MTQDQSTGEGINSRTTTYTTIVRPLFKRDESMMKSSSSSSSSTSSANNYNGGIMLKTPAIITGGGGGGGVSNASGATGTSSSGSCGQMTAGGSISGGSHIVQSSPAALVPIKKSYQQTPSIELHRQNRICRDFLQGVCRRKYCRYPHVISSDQVVFCHDFQNATCPRINCKFLHYTLEEEEYYRKYNKFPQNYIDYHSEGIGGCGGAGGGSGAGGPCNEMQMHGNCRHRECQYGHGFRLLGDCADPKWLMPFGRFSRNGPGNGGNGSGSGTGAGPDSGNSGNVIVGNKGYNHQNNEYNGNGAGGHNEFNQPPSMKRQHQSMSDCYEPFKRFRDDTEQGNNSQTDIMAILRRFEEEHNMLRRRVEANEVKIAELRASNDYLMTQNAQIRLSNAQQCSRVVNPVTVTTSQPQATQVINAVSIAPVQVQATPIVSMAAPQTQIIASSSCAPLALAANTSQGQQLALAQQSMSTLSSATQPINAAHASQIIGTSQITLTPTLAPAPSMGLTINTSQALAMSNATQPIISYPVMTHSILPH